MSNQIVGIVGGIGPESTIDYYRSIIDAYRKRANGDSPAIVITSLDVDRLIGWFTAKRLDDVVGYIGDELDRLHDAGATFAILAANTAHLVLDRLQARAKLPILSIVEAVGDVAAQLGVTRLALLGTRFTMEAQFYPEVLARRGIMVVRPHADEITWIHDRYIGELLKNEFKPETRDGIKAIVERMQRDVGIEGLIYGGTELPLLMRDVPMGLPTIDSTLVHVDAIVARLFVM
jgi:aspartate racemase